MDGFAPSYKHVMPGCSQGNNVWMLRDMARAKAALGDSATATHFRSLASGMAKQTIDKMYTASGDKNHGWFNVLFPDTATNAVAHEMRHVVDFFSVTFGLCGSTDQDCDYTLQMRKELGDWFREESVTSTWIRHGARIDVCSDARW